MTLQKAQISAALVVILCLPASIARSQDVTVNFGEAPPATGPIGPAPCQQTTGIGGPADPCSYLLHHIHNDVDVDVNKGGQVRFNVAGGGHSIAIYQVRKQTAREDIGEDLCLGFVRVAPPSEEGQPCNLDAVNRDNNHIVSDGKGDVIFVSGTNPPEGQVDDATGRLASHSATANGTFFTYRFLKTGRYLVICKNRQHLLNDWMFAFVNVH